MPDVSTAKVRRSLDRARRRKPLRVQITRQRTGNHDSPGEFVTQVRFGSREAVVLPWPDGRAEPRPA
jgi:hypothetical protein